MAEFEMTVLGKPVAQGRPRITTLNGYARAYDPKESRDFKTLIKSYAQDKMFQKKQLEGSLKLTLHIFLHYPKSATKKKIASLEADDIWYKDTKPDLDNYIKSVLDGLNGIVFPDDSKIVFIEAKKQWGLVDKCQIKVEELL